MSVLRSGLLGMKSKYCTCFILMLPIRTTEDLDLVEHLGRMLIRIRLVINSPQISNRTDLFDDLDRANFIDMTRTEILLLNHRLSHHRHLLLSQVQELRRQAAQHPRMTDRAPVGMMGPYPGAMYPIPPHNFPRGPPVVDSQRLPAPGKPSCDNLMVSLFPADTV
jgi:hypothetical protein